MRLEFPGTKGEIEENSRKHKYHSSLILGSSGTEILIDYGIKHAPSIDDRLSSIDAIFITHAHPDHYAWTSRDNEEIEIPVYMSRETYDYSSRRPLKSIILDVAQRTEIGPFTFKAFKVMHSLRCPAVCYRINTGAKTIVYAPDILDTVEDKKIVFDNIDCLIADGSSLNRNLVRRRGDKLFGHAMVKTIINWCKKYLIPRLIITHCGKQIVALQEDVLQGKIDAYSEGKVLVDVAYDGWKVDL